MAATTAIAPPSRDQDGLAGLPNELLDNIASNLDPGSLHSLALSCRKINPSATDALYESFVHFTTGGNRIARRKLEPFLRTLCERSDLAANVKKVALRGWKTERDYHVEQPYTLLSSENLSPNLQVYLSSAIEAGLISPMDWFQTFLISHPIPNSAIMIVDEDLVRGLANRVEDAHILLMLALLPNLNHLVARCGEGPMLDWNRFLSKSSTALRKLRTLHINGTSYSFETFETSLQILDVLPELRRLDVRYLDIVGHNLTLASLPTTNLTRLDIEGCFIPFAVFKKLVTNQPLVEFRYDDVAEPASLFDDSIVQLLVPCKDTLRRMALCVSNVPEPSSPSSATPPGSAILSEALSQFDKLESLELLASHFLPLKWNSPGSGRAFIRDMLRKHIPKRLQHLALRNADQSSDTVATLGELRQLKEEGALPDLRRVELEFNNGVDDLDEEIWETHVDFYKGEGDLDEDIWEARVREGFANVGVLFELWAWKGRKRTPTWYPSLAQAEA